MEQDFEVLFRIEYPRLVGLGVAMAGNAEVARDLAQETMARALRNWETLGSVDSQRAWLRRVMTNLLIDHHRRTSNERRAVDRLANRPQPAQEPDSPSRFAELLDLLPDRQRAVVALYYVDDLSVGEIADVLDIAPGTVKASLWKARRALERHVREEG